MPVPTGKASLQRLIRMTTYLSKFIPNFRHLRNKGIMWHWTHSRIWHSSGQTEADYKSKARSEVLRCEQSRCDLDGCVITEPCFLFAPNWQASGICVKVIDWSREKVCENREGTFSHRVCEKIGHYIYGKPTVIQSDHMPLVAIIRKVTYATSPRFKRMLLRQIKYEISVEYALESKCWSQTLYPEHFFIQLMNVSQKLLKTLMFWSIHCCMIFQQVIIDWVPSWNTNKSSFVPSTVLHTEWISNGQIHNSSRFESVWAAEKSDGLLFIKIKLIVPTTLVLLCCSWYMKVTKVLGKAKHYSSMPILARNLRRRHWTSCLKVFNLSGCIRPT